MNERLDWGLVNARLALADRALERALQPSPERIANAYRERAVRLAIVPPSRSAASNQPVIVFQLGGARYSIPLEHLAEVIPLHAVTMLLGIAAGEPKPGYGLLLNKPRPGLGLRVDLVEGVGHFAREDSEPVEICRYITCRTSNAGMLLSVDALLSALEGLS
jgi:hypothetical protein